MALFWIVVISYRPDDGGSKSRYTSNRLHAIQSRKESSSYMQPWEPQILHGLKMFKKRLLSNIFVYERGSCQTTVEWFTSISSMNCYPLPDIFKVLKSSGNILLAVSGGPFNIVRGKHCDAFKDNYDRQNLLKLTRINTSEKLTLVTVKPEVTHIFGRNFHL
jgi:hypothetical protein